MSEFKIDTSEVFPHLKRAPIIEAIIDIRARATVPWNEAKITDGLKPHLADYPQIEVQNSMLLGLPMKPGEFAPMQQNVGGISPPRPAVIHDSLKGLQFKSADHRQIATFSRDGFNFSRLQPYEKWENLRNEALKLWQIYVMLAKPNEIQRVGLRFINRIDVPPNEIRMEDYINPYPSEPQGLKLPFQGFLHIDTLGTPGYPFSINIVRTIQPANPPLFQAPALILDVDVFTLEPVEFSDNSWLEGRLAEMRWLKNKVFFGSVTQQIKDKYK